jgi:hypothetical protein
MSPAEDSKCIYATEMQKMRIFNKYILFSTYAIGWRGGGVEGWREKTYFSEIKKYIPESYS